MSRVFAPRRWLLLALALLGAIPSASAASTVGDLIRLEFTLGPGEQLELVPSDRFEIVSRTDEGIRIRSFEPGSFTVRAEIRGPGGTVRVEEKIVEVASVLGENDSLEPAPLSPPRPAPADRVAIASLVAAAAAALIAWVLLLLKTKPEENREPVSRLSASTEYLRALDRVRRLHSGDAGLIELSEATRQYLSRVGSGMGRAMTSEEVLAVLEGSGFDRRRRDAVREILDEGDFAKFSGWGGRVERWSDLMREAPTLVDAFPREEESKP